MAKINDLKVAKALLAEVTQRKVEEIPDEASVENWDAWDSLSHMRLILAMEQKLGRELPPEAVIDIANLQDVAKYLTGES